MNLLLYAHVSAFPEHSRALSWWDSLLNGEEEVGIASVALFGFVRLATNPRVFDPPMPMGDALDRTTEWLARPHVHFLLPGPRHVEIAYGLLRHLGVARNLTTDAQLAALAIEYQAELASNDTDFGKFPGLRWNNPILGADQT